jgi:hypothetical protein
MIVKKAVPGEWGIGSTADAMLQITKLPLLVVQPDAVRNLGRANLRTSYASEDQVRDRGSASHAVSALPTQQRLHRLLLPGMPVKRCQPGAQAAAPKQLTRQLTPPRVQQSVAQEDPKYKGRVIAIATEGSRAGRSIIQWAARNVLEKRDHVHVLRVLPKSGSNSGSAAPATQSLGETLQALTLSALNFLAGASHFVVLLWALLIATVARASRCITPVRRGCGQWQREPKREECLS